MHRGTEAETSAQTIRHGQSYLQKMKIILQELQICPRLFFHQPFVFNVKFDKK